uniref:Ig-like domain-containing protein n=1 Tax=Neogobius melanostomus TaxID=47308 RepID=A0A8C6S707_9GOBI
SKALPSGSRPWVLILTNHTVTGLSGLVGSSIELPCPIVSSGKHKVEWIFPDGFKTISSSGSLNRRWKVLSSGLALEKLELSDAGLYYCKASSGKDTDILPLHLVVIESSASTTREQVEMKGIIGQSVSLSCNASGSPLPSTSWLLPNGKLDVEASSGDGTNLLEESPLPVYPDNTLTKSQTSDETDQNSQSSTVSETTTSSYPITGYKAQEKLTTLAHKSTTTERIRTSKTTTTPMRIKYVTTTSRTLSTPKQIAQKAAENIKKPSSRPWNTR